MNYIEITCPACHEKMQAPDDRERIKCMFCGQDIHLGLDNKKINENAKADFEKIKGQLFGNYMKYVNSFKRETYSASFEEFLKDKAELLDIITAMSAMGDEGKMEVATAFAKESAAKEVAASKLSKGSERLNNNLYMVAFVLPALIGEKYNDKALADKICEVYASVNKNANISPATFESIKGGFKTKLCYITTAVCTGLGKGEDAKEIRILKDFRDNYLEGREGGAEIIHDYYDFAPTIVKRIGKSADATSKYMYLWKNYISPCVNYIEAGDNESCFETYVDMVNELKSEYIGS